MGRSNPRVKERETPSPMEHMKKKQKEEKPKLKENKPKMKTQQKGAERKGKYKGWKK